VSNEIGFPTHFVGLSPLLLLSPHLPGSSIYVIGVPLAIMDPRLQLHKYLVNTQTPFQKYFCSLNTEIQEMKYLKICYLYHRRHPLVEVTYQDLLGNQSPHRDIHPTQ
jgi:hypothetical protein